MIYLDNHSTTQIDESVLEAMLPFLRDQYANAGSSSHRFGRSVREKVDEAIDSIAAELSATADEIVITSGATESNNLAILGAMRHPRQKRRKIVSVSTEHQAVIDPLQRLRKDGFEVVLVPVIPNGNDATGIIQLDALQGIIDDQTALVTVMHANNEIGVIQPMKEIAEMCHKAGAILHTDATQAVGRFPISVDDLNIDLMSFTGHKMYGPKGIGGLYVRSRERRVRLLPQIVGGGQQSNRRSGTLNTAGIVGMAKALTIANENFSAESVRIGELRDSLWGQLRKRIPELELNGPSLSANLRLPGNLNVHFPGVEGQSLMMQVDEIAVSSGSACSSANPKPSHVLTSIGLTEDQARCSIRFGVGRFNTQSDIDAAALQFAAAFQHAKQQ